MPPVVLTKEAREQLNDLEMVVLARIEPLLKRLESWPDVSGAKPLQGDLAGHYRLRTGDYRVQFHIEKTVKKVREKQKLRGKLVDVEREVKQTKVVVEKIGHRDGFYDD